MIFKKKKNKIIVYNVEFLEQSPVIDIDKHFVGGRSIIIRAKPASEATSGQKCCLSASHNAPVKGLTCQ